MRHSRAIHEANPRMTRLRVVPGAGHVQALGKAPREYAGAVLEWFASH